MEVARSEASVPVIPKKILQQSPNVFLLKNKKKFRGTYLPLWDEIIRKPDHYEKIQIAEFKIHL